MPSFTERYHQLTKYHPDTLDKLGGVRPSEQPTPFKDAPPGRRIDLVPHLQPLFGAADTRPDPALPWLRGEALPALARLLHFTLGLTARLSGGGGPDLFLRAAPSAGGLYPTEVYVVVRGFGDLPDGVYHYHSLRSVLIPVWEGDFSADLRHHFLDHPAAAEAQCLVLFTGMYARGAWRYKERAYRRILLDTGHAAANLLEIAGALGLDADLLGGFYDEGLEELLFLERREEFPLLGVALRPRPSTPGARAQRPGAFPGEAVTHIIHDDPAQAQQNACERLYPGHPLRALPGEPAPARAFPLPLSDAGAFNPQSVILDRRSTRRFGAGALSLRDAEDMLRFAFRPANGAEGEPAALLTTGVLDLHLVVFSVDGLEPGVYGFDPLTQARTLRRDGDFRSDLLAISLGQELASDAAFAVLYTADMEKLVSKYGDRGYRYACLDAGLIGERIQLWAVHRELGSSGIGGYYDDLANELLDLPLSHGVLYLTVVGVPDE